MEKSKIVEFIRENIEGLMVLLIFSVIVGIIKILVALRLSTEKDNKKLLLEFVISVGLGLLAGTLTHIIVGDAKWAIGMACVLTWLGSKFDEYYYRLLNIGVSAAQKKIDGENNNGSSSPMV